MEKLKNSVLIRNKRASFDYELCGYKASKLIKMDILSRLNIDLLLLRKRNRGKNE